MKECLWMSFLLLMTMISFFMSFYILLWAFGLILVLLFSSMLWVIDASVIEVMNVLKNTISSQIFRSFGFYLGDFMNLIAALFLFLILMNLSWLVLYVFSSTSHLAVSFSLSFPLWLALILSDCFYNTSSFIASLLPVGAPSFLNPFLTVVGSINCYMSAGHIVLSLVGNYFMSSDFTGFVSIFVLMFSLFTLFLNLELGWFKHMFFVYFILYSDDHPLKWMFDYMS
uniref:ATP synthase F0 subunit 6 n=1 Tax=Cipangopaludina cathayensis TaxID=570432 RepID=A0A0U1XHX4_9CAEN|nr:ATP synthase F0 subunit 6 [Cipangopaludina cathayensis]AIU38943.1 ATP synthase F0 subunit 6 [Cipangopaludina cathayensis]